MTPGQNLSFSFRVSSGGAGEEETAYLEVEAVESWAELLSAGQTVLLTAAGHAGEEAEQQEVTEQGFHGAGAGGKMLKHRGGWAAIRTASVETLPQGMQEGHSSEGTVPAEVHLPGGGGSSRAQGSAPVGQARCSCRGQGQGSRESPATQLASTPTGTFRGLKASLRN